MELTSIAHIKFNGYPFSQFYFPYESAACVFSDLEDDELVFEFENLDFGVGNWGKDSNVLFVSLSESLIEKGISARIGYLELLRLRYMDISREIHEEYYFIGKNIDGSIYLSLVSEEMLAEISAHSSDWLLFNRDEMGIGVNTFVSGSDKDATYVNSADIAIKVSFMKEIILDYYTDKIENIFSGEAESG